ncbi:RING-associated factor 2 isoform 1-T4 [Cochliomyia hominivorax]
MDSYNENELVISSDEYSDDNDDDEALMKNAVRAQKMSCQFADQDKKTEWQIDQKQKELSSLIRRNKISVIYKNKSVKWLNNKKHRERYKAHIYLNTKRVKIIPSTAIVSDNEEQKHKIESECDNCEKYNIASKRDIEHLKKLKPTAEKAREYLGKKSRSPSLDKEILLENNDKNYKIESPQFYTSINNMYPAFDKVVTTHVNNIAKNSLKATEEKLKCLSNEIETLGEILETKEMEWKRLLHLKLVKEEIYSRLMQKKHILQSKEIYSHQENNLLDFKELENYLSEVKKKSSGSNISTVTIQKLIEKRANMNAEDLKREKSNTSRLHSLLVSRNMLHCTENNFGTSKGESSNSDEFFNHLEGANFVSNKRREGQFREVKCIIADLRNKNPELLPRVGKRIKSSESNIHHNISIPKFEKSPLNHFIKNQQFQSYPSVQEISFSPIGKVSSSNNIHFVSTMNNHNVRMEGSSIKNQIKDFDEKLQEKYPLCQECKCNESRFVCAGCGNQWYCSKKCQISAWEKHSELCTE